MAQCIRRHQVTETFSFDTGIGIIFIFGYGPKPLSTGIISHLAGMIPALDHHLPVDPALE